MAGLDLQNLGRWTGIGTWLRQRMGHGRIGLCGMRRGRRRHRGWQTAGVCSIRAPGWDSSTEPCRPAAFFRSQHGGHPCQPQPALFFMGQNPANRSRTAALHPARRRADCAFQLDA